MKHASQIFCEMLGQTCYPEFYNDPNSEYQEVPTPLPSFQILILVQAFVIHALHSSIFIYYARLPNKFLADVARHGVHYLERVSNKPRITLRKTKPYHLSKKDERAEIFMLLAKLFWYLRSGESHVGYLNKHFARNPIHEAVHRPSSLFKLISGNCTL
jgi:hypothetical protein